MEIFQVLLWKNGSPWGVGGARPRVVAFSCVFNSDVLPRGLKRSPGSRGLKKSPLGKSWSGRVRPATHGADMRDESANEGSRSVRVHGSSPWLHLPPTALSRE